MFKKGEGRTKEGQLIERRREGEIKGGKYEKREGQRGE